jgi:hypothetical protein
VGIQEARWDRGGTEPVGEYIVFYGEGNENHELGTGSLIHKRIISAFKRVDFVTDGMLVCMFIPKHRIKLMVRRAASMRDSNVYSTNSLNTI